MDTVIKQNSDDSFDTAFAEFLTVRGLAPDRWTRYAVTRKFVGFPKDIANIVAGYAEVKVRLRDWIPRDKLDPDTIYANPAAYRAGFLDVHYVPSGRNQQRTQEFAKNPEAIEIIKSSHDIYICNTMWSNPAATYWLLARREYVSWFFLTLNPSLEAVKHLLSNLDWINALRYTDWLSSNPGMITWIRANPKAMCNKFICANPAAIDIIQSLERIDYDNLSANPHPWAIEQMRLHQEKISWVRFSRNPGIFEEYVDQELVAAISE